MDYKEFSCSLARECGSIIKENFFKPMEKEWKDDRTPLTATDTEINSLVMEKVKKSFPEHDVLAEEESDLSNDSEYVWVCDPIDGTTPFSHGIPNAVFSLALVNDGEPVLGVVHEPFTDRLYYAEKGKGAFLNGESISVNEGKSPRQIIGVTASKSELFDGSLLVPKLVGDDNKYKVMDLGSIVYMCMLVASGEFSGAVFPFPWTHDPAAVKVIIEEAGGETSDLDGNDQRYDQLTNGFVASNGIIHDEILEAISECM